jgi:hypothetical protein
MDSDERVVLAEVQLEVGIIAVAEMVIVIVKEVNHHLVKNLVMTRGLEQRSKLKWSLN